MKATKFIRDLNRARADGSLLSAVALVAKTTQIGLRNSKAVVDYFRFHPNMGSSIYQYFIDPKEELGFLLPEENESFYKVTMELSDQSDIIIANIRKYKEQHAS